MSEEMITLTKEEYDYLMRCAEKWEALDAAGVDNWEGYSDAMETICDEDLDNEED